MRKFWNEKKGEFLNDLFPSGNFHFSFSVLNFVSIKCYTEIKKNCWWPRWWLIPRHMCVCRVLQMKCKNIFFWSCIKSGNTSEIIRYVRMNSTSIKIKTLSFELFCKRQIWLKVLESKSTFISFINICELMFFCVTSVFSFYFY